MTMHATTRNRKSHHEADNQSLAKTPTGISGFDEITLGGLPKGRPTLVCGGAGVGKTLFAMEFLVRGVTLYHEPGVFVSFEETSDELTKNVTSLGFDLNDLIAKKKMVLDHVFVERSEIEETGEYDLDGLFIRLGYAIDSIGAKRVVLDTVEALFSGLPDEGILRAELRRLFRWLKSKGVTAVITAERGDGTLTRYGLEEYVADCVILLDHRVRSQMSTRRMRIMKYRGSMHGTNEYPFLIEEKGFIITPVTSLGLDHPAPREKISTGVQQLDMMFQGKGVYRGSSILVSGTPGTGKSSLAAHFAFEACKRGERAMFFAFEESQSQIIRNMKSIGIDLDACLKKGLLRFHTSRPTAYGLEMHLAVMHNLIAEFKPDVVVLDPITNFLTLNAEQDVKSMMMRMIDFLKTEQITAFFTSLRSDGVEIESSGLGISSIMDVWILLRDIESNGERNRGIYILKARGLSHSKQIREFVITERGVELVDVYAGQDGLLMGTARVAQEGKEKMRVTERRQEFERHERELERKRKVLEAQITALRTQYDAEVEETRRLITEEREHQEMVHNTRVAISRRRKAHVPAKPHSDEQSPLRKVKANR